MRILILLLLLFAFSASGELSIDSSSRAYSKTPVTYPLHNDTVLFKHCADEPISFPSKGLFLCTFSIFYDSTGVIKTPTLGISPVNHSIVICLNGNEIYRWGDFGEPETATNFGATAVVLKGLHKGRNRLEVYLKNDGNPMPIPIFEVGDYKEVSQSVTRQTRLNLYFIQAIGIFALFGALFFFGYAISVDFKESDILYFSIFCISIFFGYIHFIMNGPTNDVLLWFKLSRIGYLFAAHYLYYFATSYTHRKRGVLLSRVISFALIPMVTLYLLSSSMEMLNRYFSLFSVLYILPVLFYCYGIIIRETIKKKRVLNHIIIVGYTFFLLCTTYDISNVGRGVDPYFWTTPYGYFLLIISIITTLAFRYRKIHHEVVQYKSDLVSTNEVLQEINAKLTSETEAKEHFIKAIAHEFRTPIHGVKEIVHGFVESEELSATMRTQGGMLYNSFSRFELIVQNLLDYEAILNDTLEIRNLSFSPVDVLKDLIEQFHDEAQVGGLVFQYKEVGEIPHCLKGDSLRVRLIIQNLIHNAIKFTHKGEASLMLSYHDESLQIKVSDTGCGIKPEDKERLFLAFQRGERVSFKQRYEGIGLGLAIVSTLVQKMGGTMSINSVVDEGSSFDILLPMEEVLVNAPVKQEGIRILVVDDTLTNRELTKMQLELLGYESVTASDGAEAVECVKEQAFDLIFMDVQMPVMNGLEATQKIKELFPELPIVGFTANASKKECLEAGMVDSIVKPATAEVLQSVISQYLS